MEPMPLETPEAIETDIGRLLENLDNLYGDMYKKLGEDTQKKWWEIEMECLVSKNRELARADVQGFLATLRKMGAAEPPNFL